MTTAAFNSSSANILIVDDKPDNLRLLSHILSHYDYKVRSVTNGNTALKAVWAKHPDLILLDINMPHMSGYEVCETLKADERTKEIPIIFLSAMDNVLDKVKAFNAGGVDYITKPFQIEEVLARIENQLTIQRLQKQLIQQNEQLAELNQNLEKLVEQKTLQTIMICGELIGLRVDKLDQKLFKHKEDILSAARQIQQIIDNLLLKSIREQSLEFKLVNLNYLLKEEISFLEADLAFKHKVIKQYIFDEEIPEIPLIYTHISQVFYNLINNAMEAMWNREVRELTIVTRQDDTAIYMDIKDTGCGIAEDDLSKIFDPFFSSKPAKGEARQADEPTGTGLGLYTCVELLKPFKGEITATSEVGKGSIFTVMLPKLMMAEP
jgi:DNA-binding response OmpR family regulator